MKAAVENDIIGLDSLSLSQLSSINSIDEKQICNNEKLKVTLEDTSVCGLVANNSKMTQTLTLSSHFQVAEVDYVTQGMNRNGVKREADFHHAYELGGVIGHGSYSQVFLARCRFTDTYYACKVINKFAVSKQQQLRDEIAILKSIEHSNIVALHDFFETENEILLILDLATGGELYQRLQIENRFNELDAKHVIYSLLDACTYLHEMDIVHRDIKLENILLVSSANNTHVKITDFGLAKVLDVLEEKKHRLRKSTSYSEKINQATQKRQRRRAFTTCGTDYYIAPEILKGEGYCETVDLWSIGVVMYILLTGRPPFTNDSSSIRIQVMSGQYNTSGPEWAQLSNEAKDLIAKLLTVDPEARITSAEALQHHWFN